MFQLVISVDPELHGAVRAPQKSLIHPHIGLELVIVPLSGTNRIWNQLPATYFLVIQQVYPDKYSKWLANFEVCLYHSTMSSNVSNAFKSTNIPRIVFQTIALVNPNRMAVPHQNMSHTGSRLHFIIHS